MLLAVFLVLSVVSLANADFYLMIDGAPAPAEITIKPSDTITLVCWSEGDRNSMIYQDTYYLSQGLFTLTNLVKGNIGDLGKLYMYEYHPEDRMEISVVMGFAGDIPESMLYSVDLHCEGLGDVIIDLFDEYYGYSSPVQTLTVHQVPEPMVLSLLLLGGLRLCRRHQ